MKYRCSKKGETPSFHLFIKCDMIIIVWFIPKQNSQILLFIVDVDDLFWVTLVVSVNTENMMTFLNNKMLEQIFFSDTKMWWLRVITAVFLRKVRLSTKVLLCIQLSSNMTTMITIKFLKSNGKRFTTFSNLKI